jgi:hypothetical protein
VAVKVTWSLLELAMRRTEVAATSLVVVELKVAEAVEPCPVPAAAVAVPDPSRVMVPFPVPL